METPDARLQRYTFLLLRSVSAFLDGELVLSDTAFTLGSWTLRTPTPPILRLTTLAAQVSERASRIYLPRK